MEEWKGDVVVVSSGAKAEEEDPEQAGDVSLVGAEGEDSLTLSENEASEDTGGVGRVWRNVEVER